MSRRRTCRRRSMRRAGSRGQPGGFSSRWEGARRGRRETRGRGAALWGGGGPGATAVVILEPMVSGEAGPQETRSLSGYTEWAHDYQTALAWIGTLRGVSTTLTPIRPPVDRLNAALVVRR